jgi:hypothetical protein
MCRSYCAPAVNQRREVVEVEHGQEALAQWVQVGHGVFLQVTTRVACIDEGFIQRLGYPISGKSTHAKGGIPHPLV